MGTILRMASDRRPFTLNRDKIAEILSSEVRTICQVLIRVAFGS